MGEHDNRSDTRYSTNDEAEVSIKPFQEKLAGKILNVSRSGLLLELATQVVVHANVEILTARVVIFGEIRYCVRAGFVFHAGVQIHDTVFVPRKEHIDEDALSVYAAGRGLTTAELLRIKAHLEQCAQCGSVLAEVTEMLRRIGRLPLVP